MPSRRPTPRLSPAERRARIVEAAVRVIQRKGLESTQVGDVVREAGVSRGTFYLHFESKRRLIGAVSRELLDRLLPRFSTPPALETRGDLEAALRTMCREALEAADRERALARLVLLGGAGSDATALRALSTHEESWRRLVARVLARSRAAGLLRPGLDLGLASECIVGTVQRVVRAVLLRRDGADCAALAASLARFQTSAVSPDGVGARAGSPSRDDGDEDADEEASLDVAKDFEAYTRFSGPEGPPRRSTRSTPRRAPA